MRDERSLGLFGAIHRSTCAKCLQLFKLDFVPGSAGADHVQFAPALKPAQIWERKPSSDLGREVKRSGGRYPITAMFAAIRAQVSMRLYDAPFGDAASSCDRLRRARSVRQSPRGELDRQRAGNGANKVTVLPKSDFASNLRGIKSGEAR